MNRIHLASPVGHQDGPCDPTRSPERSGRANRQRDARWRGDPPRPGRGHDARPPHLPATPAVPSGRRDPDAPYPNQPP